ncbi:MAG: uncharacterized protein KVP18_004558 [Porospora cf. gigantea A]|uniref:uncharacterized protein n=2 Tax=Porospora cf. gigantea A TaxID=2853593 RepID=UPI00355A7021|nr:MAG: hypothetical protein KVP18_004558 [Porospora cf. gigantea A]
MKPNSPALEDHAVSRSTPDTIVTLPPMKPNGPALEDHAVSRSTLDTIVAVPEYTTIPGQYLEASVSDLIEMAAIVKTIAKSSTRLLMIREKGLPLPGQAPLADTWGNLSFLRGLPGGSPQLIEKYRLEIVDRLAFGLESDGNLPLWFDDDYMYSLRFKFVGDMPAYVQVLRFPSPRHCSATNTCGTA